MSRVDVLEEDNVVDSPIWAGGREIEADLG